MGVPYIASRGFFVSLQFVGENPSPARGFRGLFVNQMEIAELCLLARKSFSRITNPM